MVFSLISEASDLLILLLVGGDKRHQNEDIKKAQEMAQCPIEDCENFFEGNNDENAKSKKNGC